MNFLKQNTACEIIIGPILDCVDGKTLIETLVLADITAAIYKGSTRSAITLTASGGDNNFTHIADGVWKLTLSAGNVDTLGQLKITLRDDDVFLSVAEDFTVLPANAYESLYGTDKLQVDLTQVNGAAQIATLDTIQAIADKPVTPVTDISGLQTIEQAATDKAEIIAAIPAKPSKPDLG